MMDAAHPDLAVQEITGDVPQGHGLTARHQSARDLRSSVQYKPLGEAELPER